MRKRSRSTLDFAREALQAAKASIPAYRSKFSKHLYTQHQLLALLALKRFLDTDASTASVGRSRARSPGPNTASARPS